MTAGSLGTDCFLRRVATLHQTIYACVVESMLRNYLQVKSAVGLGLERLRSLQEDLYINRLTFFYVETTEHKNHDASYAIANVRT